MIMKLFMLLGLFSPFALGLGGPDSGGYQIVNRRQGNQHLIGGFNPHDVTSLSAAETRELTEAAGKAINIMNSVKQNSQDKTPLKLLRIVSYKTQIVAGVNYDIEMDVLVGPEVPSIRCHLVVFKPLPSDPEQIWSVRAKNKIDDCLKFLPPKQEQVKRSVHLLGGENEVDSSSEDVQKVVQFAVEYINSRSNSLFLQALQRIDRVTRQVINGYRYKVLIAIAETACRNQPGNRLKTLSECPATNRGMLQMCDVSVIERQEKYTMEHFTCEPAEKKMRLGRKDHDYQSRRTQKPILGGDSHDYKPHKKEKPLIGGDQHDYNPHKISESVPRLQELLPGRPYIHENRAIKSQKKIFQKSAVEGKFVRQMKVGSDDRDYLSHDQVKRCSEHLETFSLFKEKHNKQYKSPEEEAQRFKVFCENMEKVKLYQKAETGSAIYGATKFADISEAEFKQNYLGLRPNYAHTVSWPAAEVPDGPIPEAFDWRDHGAVTPVKNQGSCGSCWAFSTTGNIEGQYAVKSPGHKLYSLSEQELVDCDKIDEGCNGGLPSQAYEALMKIGGVETESNYKYNGYGEKCKFNMSDVVVKVKGAVNISQNEIEMARWLYKNGPISIGINAFAMQFYWGGIAHPWKIFCNPKSLDHGVLIVGYGVDGDKPYWIVKNSWGKDWGRKGYYYVYRGDGTCGLNTMCTSAVVDVN